MTNSQNKSKGFALIALMIAIAIVVVIYFGVGKYKGELRQNIETKQKATEDLNKINDQVRKNNDQLKNALEESRENLDLTGLKEAIVKTEIGKSGEGYEIDVIKTSGNFVQALFKGMVSSPEFYAEKTSSGWTVYSWGQDTPLCNEVEAAKIPAELISECLTSEAIIIKRYSESVRLTGKLHFSDMLNSYCIDFTVPLNFGTKQVNWLCLNDAKATIDKDIGSSPILDESINVEAIVNNVRIEMTPTESGDYADLVSIKKK